MWALLVLLFKFKGFIMGTPKFQFSNVVVVDGEFVGCIVKTWGASKNRGIHYEVYVRYYNCIKEYDECDIKHLVYDKVLPED
jgi:hypothetical protein